MTSPDWEKRVAAAWATFDERSDEENRTLIGALAAELPEGSAEASFERACVFDSTDASDRAVPFYREALAPHLPRYQRSLAAYARALVED
jgi:tetratricopeptide repeat protein